MSSARLGVISGLKNLSDASKQTSFFIKIILSLISSKKKVFHITNLKTCLKPEIKVEFLGFFL